MQVCKVSTLGLTIYLYVVIFFCVIFQSGVHYFIVDCRPVDHYSSGHLPNSYHLDANLVRIAMCIIHYVTTTEE